MGSAYLSNSVNTRVQQDKETPGLRDVTVLEVGGVLTTVVTDWNNMCVKSIYTSNKETFRGRLQLNSQPWGIARLGNNRVMVAIPCSAPGQLVTVELTPEPIHISTVNTRTGYYTLASKGSLLVACDHHSVDVITVQGDVVKTVPSPLFGFFSCPYYMHINNKGNLLVADCFKKTVTCLTLEGQIVWVYSSPDGATTSMPRGVITTDDGDILVADWGLKKVVQLSKSGEFVRDVLSQEDGLKSPWGICVDNYGSLILISNFVWVLTFKFIRK